MKKHLIAEMTLEEFGRYVKECDIAIFPVGATEGYGHHLPMGSDWLVSYEIAKRVAEKADCFVAPPVTVGFSEDLMCYSGTLSVSTETIISFYRDVVESLRRQGIKNVLFISGHVGNIGAIDQVACEFMRDHKMKLGYVDWWRFVYDINKDVFTSKYPVGHAAEVGTSVLKYLFPELVVEDKMLINEYVDKGEVPDTYFYEYYDQETATSVMGDPFAGSVEKGKLIVENAVDVINDLIDKWK